MTKAEKQVAEYIQNIKTFSWCTDIIEHTLWGFKSAPYKTFNRAKKTVEKVLSRMESDGLIFITEEHDAQNTIHLIKRA